MLNTAIETGLSNFPKFIPSSNFKDKYIPNMGIIDMTSGIDIKIEVEKALDKFKDRLKRSKELTLIKFIRELDSMVIEADKLVISLDLVDSKSAQQMKANYNRLKKLHASIKSGEIKKSKVHEIIDLCFESLCKINMDGDLTEINKNIKPLEKIEMVDVKLDGPASIVIAPLMFAMPYMLSQSILSKLEKSLKLKVALGTYYIARKANFLVIDTTRLPKVISPQEQANRLLEKLSRKVTTRVVPVHEFSKLSKTWYAVLLVPDTISREITDITNSLLGKDLSKKNGNFIKKKPDPNSVSNYTIYLN